jgi:hypothetical protein
MLMHQVRDAHQALDMLGVPANSNLAARAEWMNDHRAELPPAFERLQEQSAQLDAEWFMQEGAIAPVMIERLVKIVRNLRVPFRDLSQFQQDDFISSVSAAVRGQLAHAMRILEAKDHPTFTGALDNFTKKGSELIIKVKAPSNDDFLLALAHGGQIHFVFIDQRIIDDGRTAEPEGEADQPPLPLEEAADQVQNEKETEVV